MLSVIHLRKCPYSLSYLGKPCPYKTSFIILNMHFSHKLVSPEMKINMYYVHIHCLISLNIQQPLTHLRFCLASFPLSFSQNNMVKKKFSYLQEVSDSTTKKLITDIIYRCKKIEICWHLFKTNVYRKHDCIYLRYLEAKEYFCCNILAGLA